RRQDSSRLRPKRADAKCPRPSLALPIARKALASQGSIRPVATQAVNRMGDPNPRRFSPFGLLVGALARCSPLPACALVACAWSERGNGPLRNGVSSLRATPPSAPTSLARTATPCGCPRRASDRAESQPELITGSLGVWIRATSGRAAARGAPRPCIASEPKRSGFVVVSHPKSEHLVPATAVRGGGPAPDLSGQTCHRGRFPLCFEGRHSLLARQESRPTFARPPS